MTQAGFFPPLPPHSKGLSLMPSVLKSPAKELMLERDPFEPRRDINLFSSDDGEIKFGPELKTNAKDLALYVLIKYGSC